MSERFKTYKHRKRGSEYQIILKGSLQVEPGKVLKDGDTLYGYVSTDDGKAWFREQSEFQDGRFEESSDQSFLSSNEALNNVKLRTIVKDLLIDRALLTQALEEQLEYHRAEAKNISKQPNSGSRNMEILDHRSACDSLNKCLDNLSDIAFLENVDYKCTKCGGEVSKQTFGPNETLVEPVTLFMCSNSTRFKDGYCDADGYFTLEAWNENNI